MPKPPPIIRIPRPARRKRKAAVLTQQSVILVQPVSQLIEKGTPVTFSVIAVGASPEQSRELTYEWQFNKAPKAKPVANPASKYSSDLEFFDKGFLRHPDSPNASAFTISGVSNDDVAFYRVKVTAPGAKAVFSKPAQLWVWEGVNSTLLCGTVYTQAGGTSGKCPGAYTKRVEYGGVWPDPSTPRKVRDQQNSGTWIEWIDYYGVSGCARTPKPSQEIVVDVVNPNLPLYFTIYIPPGKAAPATYCMLLTNFH